MALGALSTKIQTSSLLPFIEHSLAPSAEITPHAVASVSLCSPYRANAIVPILQMRKVRLRRMP